MSEQRELPGIEVYKTDNLSLYRDRFELSARTIAILGFIPVVLIEGAWTVLYAVSSGAIRKSKTPLRKWAANDE